MRRKVVLLVVAVVIAAVGASLVLMYVNGLSDKAAAQDDTVQVLTATEVINPGETAATAQSEGKLVLTDILRSELLEGVLTSVDEVNDDVALSPIYPGEQILASRFGTTAASLQTLDIPEGMLAVSVELTDPARVAGFVTPGSHVAIFVSSTANSATTAETPGYTRILIPDVTVIGVGQSTVTSSTGKADATTTTEEVPKTILTIAVNQEDSGRVIYAAGQGGLTFALLGEGTKVTPDKGVTATDLLP